MTYDFEELDADIPNLEEYKKRLVKQALLCSFFQEENKQNFDMLR